MESENEKRAFVTNDSAVKNGGKLDPTDMAILEEAKAGGGVPITSMEQLEDLARGLSETLDYFQAMVRASMTTAQAKMVRKLRTDDRLSWRGVARRCHSLVLVGLWRGWELWDPPSNQMMGIALCERAAQLLGENHEQPPWN